LPLHAQAGQGGDEARVLVVLHDPTARVRLSPVLLAQLYGLTPTEAATAAAIAEGSSPSEIARVRGCADDTVRTHLKRVLEKTGTRRQADLVRVLLTGAAVQLSRLA
jgi:DNA-binding CsgD family transcriptional regulator